jgi:hypothetical protein
MSSTRRLERAASSSDQKPRRQYPGGKIETKRAGQSPGEEPDPRRSARPHASTGERSAAPNRPADGPKEPDSHDLSTGLHRPARLSHNFVPSGPSDATTAPSPVDNRISPARQGNNHATKHERAKITSQKRPTDTRQLSPEDPLINPRNGPKAHPSPAQFVNVGTEPFRANVIHTNSQASTGCYPQRWTRRGPEPHRCGPSLGKSMWTDTKRHEVVHRLWKSVDFLLKVLGTTGR